MVLTARTVSVVAVSTLLALLGLVWFQSRKKKKSVRSDDDKSPVAKKLDFAGDTPVFDKEPMSHDNALTPAVESVKDTQSTLVEGDVPVDSVDYNKEIIPTEGSIMQGSTSEDNVVEAVEEDCVAEVVEEVCAPRVAVVEECVQPVRDTVVEQEVKDEHINDTGVQPVRDTVVEQEVKAEHINDTGVQPVRDTVVEQEVKAEHINDTGASDVKSFVTNAETDVDNTVVKAASPTRQIKVVSASSLARRSKMSWDALADNENNENSTEEISRLNNMKQGNDDPQDANLSSLKVATTEATLSSSAASPVDDLVSSNSSNSDHSEVSCDSGKGVSIGQIDESTESTTIEGDPSDVDADMVYEFEFPSDLCGLLIGKQGRNITTMKTKSGANISLSELPYTVEYQKCTVRGSQSAVDLALDLIAKRFRQDVDTSRKVKVASDPMMIPNETMQLTLPEGVSVDVIVSSIVSGGHVFVQQLTHPTFPSLERLNQCMLTCYSQDSIVPQLPRPIKGGVICAAPMMTGWYRAQVVNTINETDECDIRYVDYGGYARIPASQLKQIRSDFMSLPFQAAEGYLANITPLQGESDYSLEAAAVLEELTQGYVLQCQISGYAEDGNPYLQLYNVIGNKTSFINRELNNRSVVRWMEEQ